MGSHRFVAKALALFVASLGCVVACGSDPASVNAQVAQRQLQEQCILSAKLACPFSCAQVDTEVACHAQIGGSVDGRCDASASDHCATSCGSDCNIGCK